MSVPQTIFIVLEVICALAVTVIIMVQSGKSEGLTSAFGGGGESFLAKNQARTRDAQLARLTKWVAFGFMALCLILCLL
jgi:protein translocase, SecG subunit